MPLPVRAVLDLARLDPPFRAAVDCFANDPARARLLSVLVGPWVARLGKAHVRIRGVVAMVAVLPVAAMVVAVLMGSRGGPDCREEDARTH